MPLGAGAVSEREKGVLFSGGGQIVVVVCLFFTQSSCWSDAVCFVEAVTRVEG